MALDPSIALSFQPPQINVPIPQPLQQVGQILTLGNLMQQRQLLPIELQTKQLQLDEMRQRIQEQMNISRAMAEEWRLQDPAAAQGTTAAPLPALTGQAPAVSSGPALTGQAPSVAPDLMNLPTIDRGAQMASLAAAPDGLLPLPPPATALPPAPSLAALMTTPPAAPAAAPQGAPAAPGADIPQAVAQAPVYGFSPQFYARIMRENPLTGGAFVEGMNKTVKAQYEALHAQYGAQQDAAQREATLIQGIADEPTKLSAIGQMSNEKLISPQERDRMLALPYNDPYFKTRANQALSRSDFLTQEVKAVEEARAAEKNRYEISQRPVAEREAAAKADTAETKALQDELTSGLQSFATVNDPKQIMGWLANVGKRAQQVYLKGFQNLPPNASLDDVRQMVANTIGAPKTAESQAEATGRQQAELARLQPTIESVLAGKTPFENVDPADQKTMMPTLIERGYGQKGTPTETTGAPFAKLISDAERERLGDHDRAKTVLQNTLDLINGYVPDENSKATDQKTVDYMGPVEGLKAMYPWATLHQNVRSALVTQQQQLKKFITNGSLRGLTEKALDDMFPTNLSTPEHAKSVINNLLKTVEDEKQAYLRDLSDKVIPAGLKSTPAASGTPAATVTDAPPAWQSPVKIEIQKPGGSATVQPSPTQQTAAPATPPGKIKVHSPGPQGQDYWLDADKWPQYQKHGFTRAQ